MPYKAWRVTIEGKEHVVELHWGDFWGNLKVKVDGTIVKRRPISFGISGTTVDFRVSSVPAVLSGSGYFFYEMGALHWWKAGKGVSKLSGSCTR